MRPTSDRARETIFNVLGQWLDGCRVLDLFCGTGALGLEAMSRGAAHVTLVDLDVRWARKNAEALGMNVELVQLPALRAIEQLGKRGEKFDVVFSDPPYALEAAAEILAAVKPLLNENARVVLEHAKRESAPEGFVDQRKFGDTLVTIY